MESELIGSLSVSYMLDLNDENRLYQCIDNCLSYMLK